MFAKTTKESGETMNHYKHFTLKEREMIKHYIDIGKNQSEIAILLGRSKSSTSRELKRNSLNGNTSLVMPSLFICVEEFCASLREN